MVMCSRCHKRVAVVFVTKLENGNKINEGLCIKCAKDLGVPIDNMLGDVMSQFGLSPEQVEAMENEFGAMVENGEIPSDNDDLEEGGAPAIDMPQLFNNSGIPTEQPSGAKNKKKAKDSGEEKPKKYKFLDTYCRNLTRRAADGKLDRIIGRDRELERVIQILCRRQKNNPCLIGEPGVGKTAIAEALAQRIADGSVPFKLRGKQIYLVDMTALVAGTQFRGQFESRMIGLLNEVKEAGNVILVIDEVHNIVGIGDSEGSVNAANILKPALSRGEVRIIGATTLNEYRKYIEKDTALERRFQPITVAEPSIEESVKMLEGIKHYYEEFHSIRIPDEVVSRAVTLSERYITDRYLPDKAIDLLDEAASHLSLSSSVLNESQEIREKLMMLKDKREALEANTPADEKETQKRYEEIAGIKSEEIKLSEKLRELEPSCESVVLTEADIAEVIEVWTGIPATDISENEFEQIDKLADRIKKKIVGQDEAVMAVARAIKRNRAGISYKRKPVSFIFAGPTGVGKTELVKTLAADLFHSPETLIRLDMSEFMEKHSVSRIIGAPPGYVGYDEAGQLTEKIRRKPYAVILFDEIEKAHPDVLNVLLQVLDDGRLTDSKGRTVNFKNTIIIMTSNYTHEQLFRTVRPEFLNRVDEIITFTPLNEEQIKSIVCLQLDIIKKRLADTDITLDIRPDAIGLLSQEGYDPDFGARPVKRAIQRLLLNDLSKTLLSGTLNRSLPIVVTANDGKLEFKN